MRAAAPPAHRTGLPVRPVTRRACARVRGAASAAHDSRGGDAPAVLNLGLKEWAALVSAASAGHITAFLRRGGVREAGFIVRSTAAVLIPTSHHQQGGDAAAAALTPALLAATPPAVLAFDQRAADPLPLPAGAAFTAAWSIEGDGDEAALTALFAALSPHTGLAPAGAAARAAGAPALTLLELRVAALAPGPLLLPQATPGLWGCRSWVELDGVAAVSLGPPALAEGGAWEEAQAGLRRALAEASRGGGVRVTEVEFC